MQAAAFFASAAAIVYLIRSRTHANARSRRTTRAAEDSRKQMRRMSQSGTIPAEPDKFSFATPIPGVKVDPVSLLEVASLRTTFPNRPEVPSPYARCSNWREKGTAILGDLIIHTDGRPLRSRAFERAGPRDTLFFEPSTVRAAIVSCGGLCPGLNNVIREIFLSLTELYGVQDVFGVVNGYRGFHEFDPIPLNEEPYRTRMQTVHHEGGTFLGTSRGGFDCDKTINFVRKHRINQLYIIGGDGTHRAARVVVAAAKELGLEVTVACLPKTIDNDLSIIDASFGFATACEEAQDAIRAAAVEAKSNYRGIGIVRLFGRHSGLLAAHASLCSGDVDLCLLPEIKIELEGERGIFAHLEKKMRRKGHAVVVVAEGAGEEILGASAEVDAGGNRKLPPIGPYICDRVTEYFDSKDWPVSVKYIDPSYMIRSVRANAKDSLYCLLIGQNSVHGSMAGLTGFTTGLVNNRVVYIPIDAIGNRPVQLNPAGRTYERLMAATGQPHTEAC